MPKITKEDYERAMKFLGDPRDSVSIDSKGNVTRTKWSPTMHDAPHDIIDTAARIVKSFTSFHERIVKDVPEFNRGLVWCRTCRREQRVDAVHCLKHGWPKCCGYTMTVDHPDTWEQP